MKIALLHDSILPPHTYGGIERVVMLLAKELKALGNEILIISRKESQLKDFEHIPLTNNFFDYEKKLPLDVDIIHSHQPLTQIPKKPFLITIHGNARPGETFHPNTNFISYSHAKNHNAKYFVYNGIDVGDYKFCENKENGYAFLAKASWRVKNLKTSIRVAQDKGVVLHVMGGRGTDSEFVKYHGMVNEDAKNQILPKCKALLYLTNWDEPFGVAVLEAMACGTPVISSGNGAMPELVVPGTGFVCKSYKDILDACDQVHLIKPQDCRNHVVKNFSAHKMALGYIDLYKKIIVDGCLDHTPMYNFKKESVSFLFKPTFVNNLIFKFRGKI